MHIVSVKYINMRVISGRIRNERKREKERSSACKKGIAMAM